MNFPSLPVLPWKKEKPQKKKDFMGDGIHRTPNDHSWDARREMESCLIRIYRRDQKNPKVIMGTVGKVGTEETLAFKNLDELGRIIIGKKKQEDQENSNMKSKD